jgi:RNA polymerase sigma-70 factor (ECF subfamily)
MPPAMSIPTVAVTVAQFVPLLPDAAVTPDVEAERTPREAAETRNLVERARAGDQAAFGALVDLHERVVFRTALAALGRPEDAEDVAQDAFVMAWRKLSSFRGEAAFRTWLLTIVWRKALDRRRHRLRWWTRSAVVVDDDRGLEETVAAALPDPERAAAARERARHVRTEIQRLSPTLRDTLLLAASGDYAYPEIAAMLGIPLGTVKWRVAEARRVIAERLPHDR